MTGQRTVSKHSRQQIPTEHKTYNQCQCKLVAFSTGLQTAISDHSSTSSFIHTGCTFWCQTNSVTWGNRKLYKSEI